MIDDLPIERWKRVDAVFAAALERPPDRRAEFVERTTGGDTALRDRVLELLETSGEIEAGFLERPYLELHPTLAEELSGRAADRQASLPPGSVVGPYRVLGTLGSGGAATVYAVERTGSPDGDPLALKLFRRGFDTEDVLARFRVERHILGAFGHPDIARLLDAGATEDGRPYIVMERVDGRPITEHCDARRLSIDGRLDLFLRAAGAVRHAHDSQVVHRDLKPSNILVTADGTLKLLDFGIAKLLDPGALGGRAPRTRAGRRLLTPEYASPEQVRGEPITPATDVYQLGLLLYELLTGLSPSEARGRSPVEAGSQPTPPLPAPSLAVPRRGSRAREIAARRGSDPASLVARLERGLDRVILTALEPAPGDRYPTVDALVGDIERVLAGRRPLAARPTGVRGLLDRAGGYVGASRPRQVVAAMAALGLVVAGLSQLWPAPPPPPPPVVAVFPFTAGAGTGTPAAREDWMDLLHLALNESAGTVSLEPDAHLALLPDPAATADEADARVAAAGVSAGWFVTGSIAGRSGLDVTVRLHRTDAASEPHALRLHGEPEEILDLVNRTAAGVLAQLGADPADRVDLVSATTHSPEALGAYLEARSTMRAVRRETLLFDDWRAAVQVAIDSVREAVRHDPDFALAHQFLAVMAADAFQRELAREAADRAVATGAHLSERTRLTMAAQRAELEADLDEMERLYQAVIDVAPWDREALGRLAPSLVRYNPARGRSALEARAPIERLLELDPGHESARESLVQVLVLAGEADSARAVAAALGPDDDAELPVGVAVSLAFAGGDAAERAALLERLAGLDDRELYPALESAMAYSRSLEGARQIAGLLTDERRVEHRRAWGHLGKALVELAQGRTAGARSELARAEALDPASAIPVRAYLATLPFLELPPAELAAERDRLDAWDASAINPRFFILGLPDAFGIHELFRQYVLALLEVRLGQPLAALEWADGLDSGDLGVLSGLAEDFSWIVRAEAYHAQGRAAEAVAALRQVRTPGDMLTGTPGLGNSGARFALGERLLELGELQEAERWFDSFAQRAGFGHEIVYLAPSHLRRGQIEERRGDGEAAAAHYRRFLELWDEPDPRHRALVEQARARVAELDGG